jgi:hypothetical protein
MIQRGRKGGQLAGTLGLLVLAGACGAGNERQEIDARPPDAGPCSVSFATPQEIAATPRQDPNLELLALQLGGQIVADQGIYDRIVADVAAMRDLLPPTANVRYWALDDGKELLFSVDGPTLETMRDGRYAPWSCLNSALGVEALEASVMSSVPWDSPHHQVTLTLKGIYHLEMLAAEYQRVVPAGAYVRRAGTIGDGPTICITRDDATWHYVISDAWGDCPMGCYATTAYYFTTQPGTAPVLHGTWDSESSTPAPSWWTQYGRPAGAAAACPRPE